MLHWDGVHVRTPFPVMLGSKPSSPKLCCPRLVRACVRRISLYHQTISRPRSPPSSSLYSVVVILTLLFILDRRVAPVSDFSQPRLPFWPAQPSTRREWSLPRPRRLRQARGRHTSKRTCNAHCKNRCCDLCWLGALERTIAKMASADDEDRYDRSAKAPVAARRSRRGIVRLGDAARWSRWRTTMTVSLRAAAADRSPGRSAASAA